MSTSMLYHAFGIRDVKYRRTRYAQGEIIFEAEMTEALAICPVCGSRDVMYKGARVRDLQMVPIGHKRVWLDLTVHRLGCRSCGAIRWPRLPFADPRRTVTHAFERFVVDLLRHMTIAGCAELVKAGWDMIKDIHKRALTRRYRKIRLREVEAVAIDEFAIRKGHEYMTIVVDLATGRILHATPGKSGAAITPFLKVLARQARRLRAVAMDMSPAYLSAVSQCLPRADIVLDRYHVMALANRAIEEVRRGQQTELRRLGQNTLLGCRFLLLGNYEDLPAKKKARLDRLLKVNEPLLIMHTMKEQLRAFWNRFTRGSAASFLAAWSRDAMNSGIRPLIRLGKTLLFHRPFLLNYFSHGITSGMIEGIVNKIKTLKRQAYGFRDDHYFTLRLYHLHRQRYSLSG
jgi:transposase